MPERATVQRAKKAKRAGKSPSTQAGEFVREEIHHVREGKHGARSPEQAIAIGLSKARRAGVDLPERGERKAKKSRAKKSSSRKQPNARRSRAAKRRLKREGKSAASRKALSRQARGASRRRSAASRSAAARKAARTKGPAKRKAAARKAARTRQRRASG